MFVNKLTNVSPAPSAGITSVLSVGCGSAAPTLDKLQLMLAAGAGTFDVSKISAIRGYANGRLFYTEGTGTVHNARRDYLGVYDVASELVLDFTEPNARNFKWRQRKSIFEMR